jgi:hypothetical protein
MKWQWADSSTHLNVLHIMQQPLFLSGNYGNGCSVTVTLGFEQIVELGM